MRGSRGCSWALALSLAFSWASIVGCEGAGGVGAPDFTIVAPGTGVPSEGALFPSSSGARREFDTGASTAVTANLGVTTRWGTTLERYLGADDIRFWSTSAEHGLLYVGSTRLGRFPRPILLLPAVLRDGMIWEVRGSAGATLGTFSAERRIESTIYGADLPVWHVTQRNEVTGNELFTDYVEGYGPVATEAAVVARAIVPLEQAAPRRPWPSTALTPLHDGLPLVEDLWATHVELLEPAEGPSTLRVGGRIAEEQVMGGIRSWRLVGADACMELDGDRFGAPLPSGSPCPAALGGVFDDEGTFVQLVAVSTEGVPGESASTPFLDASGNAEAILRLPDQFFEVGWLRAVPGAHVFASGGPHAGPIDLPWRGPDALTGRVFTGPLRAGPDDAVGFAIESGDRLLHGRSVGDRIDGTLRFAARIPGGRVSARLHAAGRDLVVSTTDGMADALLIDADGISLERLAALELPDGHELVAAVPRPGALLVLTLLGREDFAALGDDPYLGALYAWSAPIERPADPSALEGPSPPEHGLAAWHVHDGIRVCWTGGRSAPELAGWTLGGAPAEARASGQDCVVVTGAPTDPARPDAYRVEGPVPGVGRVVFAQRGPTEVEPARREHPSHPIASVAGGFMSYSLRYDDHMAPIAVPPLPVRREAELARSGAVDASGRGVWQMNDVAEMGDFCPPERLRCFRVRHWEVDRQMDVVVPGGAIVTQAGGGGVLLAGPVDYGGGAEHAMVLPDGTLIPLPNVPGAATSVAGYHGVRADGLACGVRLEPTGRLGEYNRWLFCRDPDGSVREVAIDEATGVAMSRPWLPGEGGFYLLGGASGLRFVDPVALTTTEIDLTPYAIAERSLEPAWSPAGELHIVLYDRRWHGLMAVLHVAGGTITEVAIPSEMLGLEESVALLVGDRTFVLLSERRRRVWPRA